ncbi:MAG: PLDc_N domain-containing protein, partial [Xanthomonadales bacterium]|nr:PLDc_N domain-containing protein [Xanthomonadales bacterium]
MTLLLLHVLVVVVALLHILLRRHRQPESRAAWMLMVLALPYVGALAYLLVGQTSVGRARIERMREAQQSLPSLDAASGWEAVRASGEVLGDRERLFRV